MTIGPREAIEHLELTEPGATTAAGTTIGASASGEHRTASDLSQPIPLAADLVP